MTATFLKNIFSIGVTIPLIVSLDIRYTYFKWADPPCQTKISVYRTILAVSRLQCSLQCVNDMESICNKAVWDTVNSICMLHSKTVDFGTSKMVEVAPHLQVVRRVLRGKLQYLYNLIWSYQNCYMPFPHIQLPSPTCIDISLAFISIKKYIKYIPYLTPCIQMRIFHNI